MVVMIFVRLRPVFAPAGIYKNKAVGRDCIMELFKVEVQILMFALELADSLHDFNSTKLVTDNDVEGE